MAAKWQKEAEDRAREEYEKRQKEYEERNRSRRSSRFEVVPAHDVTKLREIANNEMLPPQAKKAKEGLHTPNLISFPRKSILKKTNSFNLRGFTPVVSTSPSHTPYSTITAAESRLRSAFDIIFKKSATLQDVVPDQGSTENNKVPDDSHSQKSGLSTPNSAHIPIDTVSFSPNISKKVQLVWRTHAFKRRRM